MVMFEDTSIIQEFARRAKRHFSTFRPTKPCIIASLTFLLEFAQCFKRFLLDYLWTEFRPVLCAWSFLSIGSAALNAQIPTKIWTDNIGDHNWFSTTFPDNLGNWETAAGGNAPIPTGTDIVVVNNGTTAQIGAAPNGAPNAMAGTLIIGETLQGGPEALVGSTVQVLPGGTLTLANPLIIGKDGTLLYSGGQINGVGSFTFENSGSIELDASANLRADISGTGKFTENVVGGIVSVFSSNIYSGATMLVAGTFQANSTTAFSSNSAFTVNSILDLNGFNNTIGSLSGTGTVTNSAGTATLVVGKDNSNTNFAGVLENGTGFLQLTKSGEGTLTLTGTNIYTGGSTISAGTLQLGNGGTSGSIIGNVTDNGILAFDRSDAPTFAGIISGLGSVTQIGPGTTILTGTNTYTGGTTISAGTLQLGNGGTTGSITGNVTDNGILAFDRSDAPTFAGVISGLGSLAQIGPGTTILTATNTYTGGTTISAGTLQLGNGGSSGSITGNVTDNGTLAFNRSDSVNFGGVISGTGNVVKLGTGSLTLTGANSSTGSTTVNSGSLIVDGSTMSAQTLVNAGAFLGGHGTIGGNLVNSGTISQINSPGTLTVTGNYTQNPGGTLRIGVAGVAAGQHDLLAVGGHATLGGTLQLISLGGFSLQPGNQITFLTANKGVSGTFNNAQNGLVSTGTIVVAQITMTSDSVALLATQGSFTDTPGVATNPNNVAVAKALDSARGDPREAALFAFLNSQPLANLPHDLTLIAPTQVTSINATAVSVGKVQVSNVGQRLANIRGGSNGFSSAGLSISGGAASIGEGFAGVSGPEGKSGPAVFAPTPDNRWGVFVTGLGEFSNVDSTPDAAGYDVNTGGVTFGVDYRLTPNFAIGLTGGYAHTSVGLDGGGNIDVNGGKLGLYATLFGNGFYLDTAATGGPSGYNTHRAALQGTASGSTDGADFNALIAVGYDWTKGNLSIGPTASFQFGYTGLNSFTETGSLAPLKFPDQNTESERSAFGAKASYQWKLSHVTVIPQLSAAWQHEYGDSAYSIVSSFATGAGKSFTVTGPDIGRDSILVGAGATVIWNERVSTYLYYDGEFARTNYLSNNVSGGVRISF